MFKNTPITIEKDFCGQKVILTTGLLARQAGGSVIASIGETTVMANVVVGKEVDFDYFPLQVIYEEKMYASGKISGGRINKREGKPSDDSILTGRMIDRSLRSLFNDTIRNEIQVIVTVLSIDEVNQPDVVGVLASSTALMLATSSFRGPVSCVRVGLNLKDKSHLFENLIKNINNTEEFESLLPQIINTTNILDPNNPLDKLVLKEIITTLHHKNKEWVKEFSKIFKNLEMLSIGEILKKYPELADYKINPSYEDTKNGVMDLVISGSKDTIMMIECGGKEISENIINTALDKSLEQFEFLNNLQLELFNQAVNQNLYKPQELKVSKISEKYSKYFETYTSNIEAILYDFNLTKDEKNQKLTELLEHHLCHLDWLKKEFIKQKMHTFLQLREYLVTHNKDNIHPESGHIDGNFTINLEISQNVLNILEDESSFENLEKIKANLTTTFFDLVKTIIKDKILEEDTRVDGRHLDEIRDIKCQIDVLPRVHGSSLFSRGETQVLNVLTLGTLRDAQLMDNMEDFEETTKRYIHHYNFPSYSVGETGRYGPPGRREIGHGALAEKALLPVLPDEKKFPYTIRLVSECLSSNGSTSMASTCASTLSLMAGGVPISSPVAGIAMGLVLSESGETFKVLTDIQGLEDHYGEMDFKVTGTTTGVTALQLDNKAFGLTPQIIKIALERAKTARLKILEIMQLAIEKPKPTVSKYALTVEAVEIPISRIGEIIGSSGKNIKSLIQKYNVEIDIEENSGFTHIYGKNKEDVKSAKYDILATLKDYKVGEKIKLKITRIEKFGAFGKVIDHGVEVSKEGFIHISNIAKTRIDDVSKYLKLNQVVEGTVAEFSLKNGLSVSLI